MADEHPRFPRPVLITALALSGLLALGVISLGLVSRFSEQRQQDAVEAVQQARRTGPLALPPIPSPGAEGPECAKLLAELPAELAVDDARVPRRELADPVPPGAVAWGDAEHDPITVRCGLPAPAELTPTSPLVQINGVQWLRITEAGNTSWLAVDRPVYVALTAPENSGSGPVQDLSDRLRALPAKPVFP
ncbi:MULTISPECIES: DUF3515 domain-containing protein [Saccharopolyspora]|uniref:DUF3515 domain-containing protein n=1 Tax=Saccharopolyspora gregorii TaxID=33914 RepID=A0ABP6RK06_9PSEU|nr:MULTISPECIES: DUF3515 domain-containing protein [Saccharopolyspora]MCA1190964.1 DUF3515 domain-containing protein [Saccharopolyspora sp. 6V]MCA1227657.1 DUF3515 domain-containing protein [Saccharopolyspora sp. 6M]